MNLTLVLVFSILSFWCIKSSNAVFVDEKMFNLYKEKNNKLATVIDDVGGYIVVRGIQIDNISETEKQVKEQNLVEARNMAFFYAMKYLLNSEVEAKELLISVQSISDYIFGIKVLSSSFDQKTNRYSAQYEVSFVKDKIEFKASTRVKEDNIDAKTIDVIVNFSSPEEWNLINERLRKCEIKFQITSSIAGVNYLRLEYRYVDFEDLKTTLHQSNLELKRTLNRLYIVAI